MADSPSKYSDRILAWTVYAGGARLDGSYELVSARIRLELNRIGKATLCFNAGDMDAQTFDESDSDNFKPGNAIRIDAGDLNDQKTLFEGIILQTGIRIGKGHRSMMVVECRDNAWPATQGRHNRIFEKKKDSEMISEVLSAYGAAEAVPGCIIELKGLGSRFNGNAFIGSVTHIIEKNEWITEAGIGIDPASITDEPDVVSPPAAGLLPGMEGLHTAVVKKLDGDPAEECRIQVELPWLEGDSKLLWARLSTLYATGGSGAFWLPEPGDEVLVGFVNNDPTHPVILGGMYGSKHKPPYEYTAENHTKAFVTREKLRIEFDEEKKIITVSTPGNNKVELSDDTQSVTLSDANGNEVKMDKDGIALSSAKDIKLTAKGNIALDATMKLTGTAKQDAALEGMNVTVQGKVGATVKGNATAELSASGQTTVKGAMVMIN